MNHNKIPKKIQTQVSKLVDHYDSHRSQVFQTFLEGLNSIIQHNKELNGLIHSVKFRTKSLESLEDKLQRKYLECVKNNKDFNYTVDNLFIKVNDLAGFRILHLYSRQFQKINEELIKIFDIENFKILEGPKARIWDDETRKYFNDIGIKTVISDRMYSSVHYVIDSNKKTKFTAEIQVRTLGDEIWGEVDHKINYPHPTDIYACSEQIKVLARITSSCTRLVDSIFNTYKNG